MCGIAGVMLCKKDDKPNKKLLENFASSLHHRGSNGHRIFIDGQVGLVHTRLAIVDLEQGNQPLFDEKGRALVANGEIYNNPELRQLFSNYPYKTHSDCESILAVWNYYYSDMLKYLRGMFAFALYDAPTGELILCRDPFGMKPLYYCEFAEGFAFSSETQALHQAGLASVSELEEQGLKELMQLGFTTEEKTLFPKIKRVLPGEILRIVDGRIVERRSYKKGIAFHLSEPENPIEALDTLLKDSINVHLRCEVPYGMFLSHDMASAAILALMSQQGGEGIKTYSVSLPGSYSSDERLQVRKVAQFFKADQCEVEFKEEDFWQLLPKVAWALDDPVMDYTALPTYKLAQTASKDVRVILCGEGSNEVFAGYRRYQKARWPRWLGGRLWQQKGIFQKTNLLKIKTLGWEKPVHKTLKALQNLPMTPLQKAQSLDFHHSLPNQALTKLDRCLGVQGIEGRMPFVDREIASFGVSLGDEHKIHWGTGQWILQQWLKEYYPIAEPFTKSQDPQLPIAIEQWLSSKKDWLKKVLPSQAGIKAICKPDRVKSLLDSLSSETLLPAWSLLFYAVWHQQYLLGIKGEDTFELLEATL